jgi:hypothetical protein
MIVDRYGFRVAISDIFTKQVGSTLSWLSVQLNSGNPVSIFWILADSKVATSLFVCMP